MEVHLFKDINYIKQYHCNMQMIEIWLIARLIKRLGQKVKVILGVYDHLVPPDCIEELTRWLTGSVAKSHCFGACPSGQVKRLIIRRLWDQIPARNAGKTFFKLIYCEIEIFDWKDWQYNKSGRDWSILKNHANRLHKMHYLLSPTRVLLMGPTNF